MCLSQTLLDQSIDLCRVMGALEKLPNRRKVRQRLSNADKGKYEAMLERIERRFLLITFNFLLEFVLFVFLLIPFYLKI